MTSIVFVHKNCLFSKTVFSICGVYPLCYCKQCFMLFQSLQQLELWRRSLRRVKKEIVMTDVICEKHFKEEDIIRYYETKLPDGRVWKLAKGMPDLKKTAVPKLYLDLQSNSNLITKKTSQTRTSSRKKRSAFTEVKQEIMSDDSEHAAVRDSNVISIKKEIETDSENVIIADSVEIKEEICSDDDDVGATFTEDDVGTAAAEEVETFNFNTLVDRVKDISKPNAAWGITAHVDFVMCAKWDENYSLERRVTIDSDLKVKVSWYLLCIFRIFLSTLLRYFQIGAVIHFYSLITTLQVWL